MPAHPLVGAISELVGLGGFVGVAAAWAGFAALRYRRRLRAERAACAIRGAAAARLGLGYDGISRAMSGHIDGFEVDIRTSTSQLSDFANVRHTDRMTIAGGLPMDAAMAPGSTSEGRGGVTGDSAFDREVGPRAYWEVFLAMTQEERDCLREAVKAGWRLNDGVLGWDGSLPADPEADPRWSLGLAAAGALRTAEFERELRLGAYVRGHPDPEVRRRALLALRGAAFDAAVATALQDPFAANRLFAANHADHHATIMDLALTGYAPALNALTMRIKRRQTGAVETHITAVLRQWLVLGIPESDEQRIAFAFAATVVAVDEAEPILIGSLATRDTRLQSASIAALGKHGTVRAVPELRRLGDHGRDAAIRNQARDAALAIRARLTGAETGAISLAEAIGGELAMASVPSTESEDR